MFMCHHAVHRPACPSVNGVLAGLVLCLAGCSGGSDADAVAEVEAGTSDFTAAAQALYAVRPDTPICRAGTLSAAEKTGALSAVNAIRAIHGLAPVSQDSAGENEAMQIALMSAVNGRLSHEPTSAWGCYTAAGAQGAGSSNLYLGGPSAFLPLVSSASILANWLADVGSEATLGHRRWLLDPFLKQVAFGRVDVQATNGQRTTGAALKVVHGTDGTGPVAPDYVAYPVGEYPATYFQGHPILSFTAIADKTSRQGNGSSAVDFSTTTVSVVPQGGAALAVSGLAINHEGYGVPNNLRFHANGLQTGVVHDVTVANVRVNGVARNYRYTFRLLN